MSETFFGDGFREVVCAFSGGAPSDVSQVKTTVGCGKVIDANAWMNNAFRCGEHGVCPSCAAKLQARVEELEKDKSEMSADYSGIIGSMRGQIKQAEERVEELERTFIHSFVSNPDDSCRKCGLDLRDSIHRRL